MSETRISAAAFADTKPHYELLDGLRGVAALLVVFYHIFEGLSFAAGGTLITTINHGYLAVDFFFLTSSSCHPKIFVKEFSYFLMPCHQHCLGVNLLVQR